MYSHLFLLLFFSGATYFLLKVRQFDYFSVAYFGAAIYFLPGFFGITTYHIRGQWIESAVCSELYIAMSLVLFSIFISGMLADKIKKSASISIAMPPESYILWMLVAISSVGLIGVMFTTGSTVNEAEKEMVMESLGRWHILMFTGATLGLPLAYSAKNKTFAAFFTAILIFNLYLGFRVDLAIAIISILVIEISSSGKKILITKGFKVVIFAVFFAVFLFLYKFIAFAVKSGMWELILDQLENPDLIEMIFIQSEPFVVQATFNEILLKDFQSDAIHIYGAVSNIIPFSNEIGLPAVSFNSIYQPALFGEVEYGMANNIWAQMWSGGGWPMFIIFLIVFNWCLAVGNISLRSKSTAFRALCAPMFCNLAFYIHRNDLGYIINIEKRLAGIILLVYLSYWIVHYSTKQSPKIVFYK